MELDFDAIGAMHEGLHLEAKSAASGFPKNFWESYAAMANTDGGTILLGVSEEPAGQLEASGVYDVQDIQRCLWNTLNNPTKVSANLLCAGDVSVCGSGAAQVVRVDVPRAPRGQRPIFLNGNPLTGTFRRNGEGDYRCSREEYEAMVRDSAPQGVDGTVVEACSMASLCGASVAAYQNHLKAARPGHPWAELDSSELLVRLGAAARSAVDHELHPTRAGLLCFGYEYEITREFPQYFLDYRDESERGVERWSDRVVSNDGTWSGNLFDFWRMVAPRLGASLRRPFSLDASMRRVDDTPMHRAVREGLVNALVHADYLGRRGTVVVKRAERVEFSNPGSLLVAREVALGGGISEARNPIVMKIFCLINACEKAGSGFDAMRGASAAAGALPPELEERYQPDRTELTLYLGNASAIAPAAAVPAAGAVLGEAPLATAPAGQCTGVGGALQPDVAALTHDEQLAIEYLGAAEEARPRVAVQQALGWGSTKAKKLLGSLVAKGLVVVEGSGNRVAYRRCS